MRDIVIALISGVAALGIKAYDERVSLAFSWENLKNLLFPIAVCGTVFLALDVVRAARHLIREVKAESEQEIDLYPSLVLPERVIQKHVPSLYRLKIVSMATSLVFMFVLACAWTWSVGNRSKPSELITVLPTQKPVQSEFRFAVTDPFSTIRVTVNGRHFWTHLNLLSDNALTNFNFEEKGVPITIRTRGTDNRPYVNTKVYSAELGVVEIRDNRLATRPRDWDENSSDRVIEIVNEHRIPVFRMVLSAANQIDIEATFSEEDSKRRRMVTWFSYPSDEHRGQNIGANFFPLQGKSLYQLFLEGCGKGGSAHGTFELKSKLRPNDREIDYMICSDFDSRAVYLNIFITTTQTQEVVPMIREFAGKYKGFLTDYLKLKTIVKSPGAPIESSSDLVFTGVIGIYHEGEFLMGEAEQATAEFKRHGARVRFYGPDYAIIQNSPLLN